MSLLKGVSYSHTTSFIVSFEMQSLRHARPGQAKDTGRRARQATSIHFVRVVRHVSNVFLLFHDCCKTQAKRIGCTDRASRQAITLQNNHEGVSHGKIFSVTSFHEGGGRKA